MKIKADKKYAILPVILCIVLTAVYCVVFVLGDDRTAPQIHMDSDVLSVSVEADDSQLLQGVTATDNKDGDVTADILIENISKFTSENTATITYVAYDSSGNASKAGRTVKFTDYQPPKFGQDQALVFSSNTAPDVLGFMTATDKIDGDISANVKGTLLSEATSLNYPGTHTVEFRVTNSMGDTQYITLPVDVYEGNEYNGKVELTDYLVYLPVGAEFDPQDYLENLVVGTIKYPLDGSGSNRIYINNYVSPAVNPGANITNIEIKSDVDTDTPGVYSVAYTVDYAGRYTGFTRLNVVVEE